MTVIEAVWPYLAVLVSAFSAATLLPLSSEAVLVASVKAGLGNPGGLLVVATVGNVGGSTFNWWLGRNVHRFEGKQWFPFAPGQMATASNRFRSWGIWSLLLAWMPVIGDPLTFAAGLLRVPILPFLTLVTIGKAARYAALVTWI